MPCGHLRQVDTPLSEIRRFHDEFYAVEPEPPPRWPATYDRLSSEELPPMARHALEHPNDILLKPEFVRQVVGALLERRWHPRHIAGLLRSKYERDYGWLNMWYIYSALTRADFHVRVLAGMIRTGRDRIGSLKCEVRSRSSKIRNQPSKITLPEG
jgi:hypothetical protein